MKYPTNKKVKILDATIVLLVLLFGFIFIISYNFFQKELTSQVTTYGLIALFIISALLEFIPQKVQTLIV